jgi:hypothetical protein
VAAVIAVAAGLLWAFPRVGSELGGSDSATQADGGAAAPGAGQPAGGPAQLASGRDYAPGGFGGLADSAARAGRPTTASGAKGAATATDNQGTRNSAVPPAVEEFAEPDDLQARPGGVPTELARLSGGAARQMCLEAIQADHGGSTAIVDYARFNGRPAMVAVLHGTRDGGARPWVVVVGPDCGVPPGFTDERFSGPAGA